MNHSLRLLVVPRKALTVHCTVHSYCNVCIALQQCLYAAVHTSSGAAACSEGLLSELYL